MATAQKISSGVSGPANVGPGTPRQDPVNGNAQQKQLHERWMAYKGIFNGPLSQLDGQPDLNIIANRVGTVVRSGVDFLFGPVLKMQHPTGMAQDILQAVWGNDDQRMTTLVKSRVNGGVYGHVFLKLVTPKNGKPPSIDNPPRFVVQNPELYDVDTEPDDVDEVTCYRCTWSATDALGNSVQKMQTTQRVDPDDPTGSMDNNAPNQVDPDVHWEIQNWIRANTGGEWQMDGPVMMWPYKLAPIIDWQNYPNPNEHWGTPDVDESVVNLNRNLHLIESNTNSTLYSQGHPWLFATGADTSSIKPTPGAIHDLGSPDAKVFAVNASGAIPDMINFAASIRADMDEATSTPGVATGRMVDLPRGQISGITMHLLYGPRILRTEQERRLYGQGIRDACRLALTVCGQEAAAAEEIDLTWTDALPTDDLAMAQMGMAMEQMGFSKHTIFSLMGEDYDTELEYLKQEADDQNKMQAAGLSNPPMPAGFPSVADGSDGSGAPPAAGTGNGGNMPPVNHPAAIQQRAAMKAASAKVKLQG